MYILSSTLHNIYVYISYLTCILLGPSSSSPTPSPERGAVYCSEPTYPPRHIHICEQKCTHSIYIMYIMIFMSYVYVLQVYITLQGLYTLYIPCFSYIREGTV